MINERVKEFIVDDFFLKIGLQSPIVWLEYWRMNCSKCSKKYYIDDMYQCLTIKPILNIQLNKVWNLGPTDETTCPMLEARV
jgi:hypothetical protein